MNYLLDTNVLSELPKRNPNFHVARWMEDQSNTALHLSVLTLGELRKGIAPMPDSPRKQTLLNWLEIELPRFFADRVLPIDTHIADFWGRLVAIAGRPVPAIDSLLAATALSHGLTLVTRNWRDFQYSGLTVINPWLDRGSLDTITQ